MWVRLGDKLTLFADDIEIGEIGAGEELEVVLPAGSQFVDIKIRHVLTPLTLQALPVDQVKDGDTILIKSVATMRDIFSHELLELEIVQPDTFVEVGTSKWPAFLAAVAAAIFLTFVTIALVKEGPRLIKGYDSNKQMEAAESAGFTDKETFLAAQAVGISSAKEWSQFSADMSKAGFDDAAEFIAFREQEKATQDDSQDKDSGSTDQPDGLALTGQEDAYAYYYCVREGPSKTRQQPFFYRPSEAEAQRSLDSTCNFVNGGGGAVITQFQYND
jgi:hypothetical protein